MLFQKAYKRDHIKPLKSVREKLTIASLQKEISEWKNKYQKVLDFVEKLNLTKQLQEFLKLRKHTLHR